MELIKKAHLKEGGVKPNPICCIGLWCYSKLHLCRGRDQESIFSQAPDPFYLSEKSESAVHSVMFDSATSWAVTHQAPLSMGFSKQEYWSG